MEINGSDISFTTSGLPWSSEVAGNDITFIAGLGAFSEVFGADKSFIQKRGYSGDIHIDQLIYKHTDRMGA